MSSIDKGVYELRQADKNGWYRVLYYTKVNDQVVILHSFTKKSGKTEKTDLNMAETRLENVKARVAQEKKYAKR